MTDRYEVCRPHVVAETIDGEVVAINLDSGSYYSLEGTGAAIWEAIDQGAPVSQIGAALGEQVDLRAFVAELEAEGLVRPATNGLDPADRAWVPPEGPLEPPRLEKFTDLEDLLLLDPVHDIDARGWPHTPSG
jgi:hypothetical protein